MLVTAGQRCRCAADCGVPIEADELVEYRRGHILCPTAPVTRDTAVTGNGLANGHAPLRRDPSAGHGPVTRDTGVTNGSARRDSLNGHAPLRPDNGTSHAGVTREFALNSTGQDRRGQDRTGERGSFASPGEGAGAPDAADQADHLLDEYERTVLPTMARIGDGTFTVGLAGPADYVTFTLETLRDDPEAQRALPFADSKHPLSHQWEALFGAFAIVRGRRAMPVRKLLADARPEVQKPLRRLLLGLEAVLRSADSGMRYGLAYARQARQCFRCGETLSTPESLNRGLGPRCFLAWRAGR